MFKTKSIMTARLNAYIPKDEPTHFVLAGLVNLRLWGQNVSSSVLTSELESRSRR